MFRFMRPRTSVFSMSRLPLRLEAQAQRGQATNVQKVHFRKPGMRPRSIAISILTVYVCYSIYSKVVLDPLEHAAQEALKNIPEDEFDEEAEDPLFIPFPGTTKQKKPEPYRGSDPEWQEFIKFSKDQALAKSVREELAGFVKTVAERHPLLVMRCGKDMKLRRYWLDVDFPLHPPPEFERSGLLITDDDRPRWTTMPVDSLTVFRIRQALWPSALVQSTWSFTKVLIADDIRKIAELLGLGSSSRPPPPLEQILARNPQLFRGPIPTKDGPPAQPQTIGDATKAITGANGPDKSALTGRSSEEIEMAGAKQALAFRAHLTDAMKAFKKKFAQTFKPAPNYPPRGSILISGLVEIDSPRAWLVFDVRAAWDPKTKTFDARSMSIQMRRTQLKKQGPIGRP